MRPAVEVEIVNRSSRDLENAEARFGDYACKWGSVLKGTSASYMYYPHPISDQVVLHWHAEGSRRMEMLDLGKVYPRRKPGRLTFTVYDDRVAVSFREN